MFLFVSRLNNPSAECSTKSLLADDKVHILSSYELLSQIGRGYTQNYADNPDS